jgi:hypothetical protein
LQKIVSGGQTGADRAALDWAIERGVAHGGWCPRGRRAEDGRIPDKYQLVETPAAEYEERTRWNVRDSDATAVIGLQKHVRGGSWLTLKIARELGRPCIYLWASDPVEAVGRQLAQFVVEHAVSCLNVAGPRESHEPGVGRFVADVLSAAFGAAGKPS